MQNKSFRQHVIDLEIGEKMVVSIDEVSFSTIRNYASDLGFAFNRTYQTSRDREARTYTITRIS